MRTLIYTILFFSFINASGQPCLRVYKQAQKYFKARQLEEALKAIKDLEYCDERDNLTAQRQKLQDSIFTAINQQRLYALKAKAEAQAAKDRAESALQITTAVLNQLYFYEDKFGLTLKNKGAYYDPVFKYGYINKEGDVVIDFEYDEASPFYVVDSYARVSKGEYIYLLDTTNHTYLLTTNLDDNNPGNKHALDLHLQRPIVLGEEVENFTELEVLLAYGEGSNNGKLVSLPDNLGKLEKLKDLNLHSNRLEILPGQIKALKNLQFLNLSDNNLQELGAEVGELQNLRSLYLHDNALAALPFQIGKLDQLEVLELSDNQINRLPSSLKNLSSLTS
ncbi:MAG: leucine-rich repeat domain-containing protein, partial [Bacteroidota bacterium]